MSTLLLSCEHGGNEVPPAFSAWFKGASKVLASHRGWDPGALDLFMHLRPLAAMSISARLSRLVIELNRSERHPDLFSTYTRELPTDLRKLLLEFYWSYRLPFMDEVRERLHQGQEVVHVSVHSFTHVLDGVVRNADIGLLYDPKRKREKAFCERWRAEMMRRAPGLRIRMNYPYTGTSDGFTTALRKVFPKGYSGIELEVDQRFANGDHMHADIRHVVYASLEATLLA